MRLFARTLTLMIVSGAWILPRAMAFNGELIPEFGNGGIVTSNLYVSSGNSPSQEKGRDIALRPDESFYVAGESSGACCFNKFLLARYTPNGSLDPSFGDGGKVLTSFSVPISSARVIALSAAGTSSEKIVLAGSSGHSVIYQGGVSLARYNADGSLDAGFGASGKVITFFGQAFSDATSIAFQSDGKFVIAGYATDSWSVGANGILPYYAIVARYTTSGALDPSFGTNGRAILAVTGASVLHSVVVQSDGKILVGGSVRPASGSDNFLMARFDSSGVPDSTFGTNGVVVSDMGPGHDRIARILDLGTRFLVVGTSNAGTNSSQVVLLRYMPTGSLDSAFGTGGRVLMPFSGPATAATVQVSEFLGRSSQVVVVGTVSTPSSSPTYVDDGIYGNTVINDGYGFAMSRVAIYNGAIDLTFGKAGVTQLIGTGVASRAVTNFNGGRTFYITGYSIPPYAGGNSTRSFDLSTARVGLSECN